MPVNITPIFEMLNSLPLTPNINLSSGHLCAWFISPNRLKTPGRQRLHLGPLYMKS